MNHTFITLICCLLISPFIEANPNFADDYITRYQDLAVREMERTGIPASITLAQGMFESQYGQSDLAKKANNHFGIKCKSDWSGETYRQHDDQPNECFKKYQTVYDSYIDHSDLLKNRTWYQFLFLLDPTDYKSWAAGLFKAGYATDEQYAAKLIEVIERHQLYQLDKTVPKTPPVIFAKTIGIDGNSESVLQDYHSARLRGDTPPAAKTEITATQKANNPANALQKAIESPISAPDSKANELRLPPPSATPSTSSSDDNRSAKPQRSTDMLQSDIATIETAFSHAQANRPNGTQRQNLTGAPAVSISSNDIESPRINPRRPANKTTETPTNHYETRPVATDAWSDSYEVPADIADKSAITTDTETTANDTNQTTEQPAQMIYTAVSSPLAPAATNQNGWQLVSDNNDAEKTQNTYLPPVQTADAQPPILLAAYHTTATNLIADNNATKQAQLEQTIIDERRVVIYPYEISLKEVAAKHDVEINLLQHYNKGIDNKTKIAAGTPIFLQAPLLKGY